jgi:hypothetical protein
MASDKIDFRSVGQIAQAMKYQARAGAGWENLPGAAQEAIDQILSSLARTVSSGQGAHWDGIMAYADSAKPGTDEPEPAPPAREKGQGELEDAMQRLARDRVNRGGQNG